MNLHTLCIWVMLLIHVLHLLRDRNEMRAQEYDWDICSLQSVRLKTAIYQSLYCESCPKHLTERLGSFIITLPYGSLKSHDHKTISDSADLETMSWIEMDFPLFFLQAECGQLFSEMTFLWYHFNSVFYMPPVTANAQELLNFNSDILSKP